MKSTLKLLAIIATGLIICYVALIDSLLKQVLEQQGSQLLKAKLEVSELQSSLFPPSLTIYNLAATNPDEPLRNIISADEIIITPQIKSLLKKKILIDSVTIKNLRFQQRRASSGAIEGLTPNSKASSTQLSTTNQANTNPINTAAIIEKIKVPLIEDINSLNAQALDIKTQWQQRRAKLINPSAIQTYSDRWAALNKATPIDKLNGFRQLENAINADIATITASQNKLTLDIAVIDELHGQAQQFIAQRVDAGINSMTQTNAPSLTESLLAGKMKATIGTLLAEVNSKNAINSAWPIYIKSIQFNAFIEPGNEPLAIEGFIERIYYGFEAIKRPTKFSIKTSQSTQGELSFSGIIDQRNLQNIKIRAQLQLTNVPVATLSLSHSDEFRIMLGRATMSASSKLDLNANQLQLNIDSQFRDAQLTVETNLSGSSNAQEANNDLTTSLADMLRGIDRLDINLLASGDIDNPQFSVSSSIDPLLQASSNQVISNQYSNLRPQLQQDISASLMSSLGELKSTRDELQMLAADLAVQQQNLHNLLTPFH
jgi:hypothetical protein